MSTIDPKWARDIGFPFRFTEDCNLVLDEDEAIIDQALQLITFVKKGTVILFNVFGSAVEVSVFDPLDDATELVIDTSLRLAFEELEPRVFLEREFTFDQTADELKLIIIAPYKIKVTGKLTSSRFIVDRPITG